MADFFKTYRRGQQAIATDEEAARKATAKAVEEYLKPLFKTNNSQAVYMPSLFTKDKIRVSCYDISDQFRDFQKDRKIQEMVWRKGYFFSRGPGSGHYTVNAIEKPSDDENFPGFRNFP